MRAVQESRLSRKAVDLAHRARDSTTTPQRRTKLRRRKRTSNEARSRCRFAGRDGPRRCLPSALGETIAQRDAQWRSHKREESDRDRRGAVEPRPSSESTSANADNLYKSRRPRQGSALYTLPSLRNLSDSSFSISSCVGSVAIVEKWTRPSFMTTWR